MNRRGMTLTEIMLASVMGLVVILAVGQVDLTRVRLMNAALRPQATLLAAAGLTLDDMVKQLVRADRINLISPSHIQIRLSEIDTSCPAIGAGCPIVCTGCTGAAPPSCCYDIPGNYRWVQYKLVNGGDSPAPDTVNFYNEGDCTRDRYFGGFATSIKYDYEMTLTILYRDESPAPPPGVDLFVGGEDTNTVWIEVTRTLKTYDTTGVTLLSTSTETKQAQATIRDGAYTNLTSGLAPSTASFDPPPGC